MNPRYVPGRIIHIDWTPEDKEEHLHPPDRSRMSAWMAPRFYPPQVLHMMLVETRRPDVKRKRTNHDMKIREGTRRYDIDELYKPELDPRTYLLATSCPGGWLVTAHGKSKRVLPLGGVAFAPPARAPYVCEAGRYASLRCAAIALYDAHLDEYRRG